MKTLITGASGFVGSAVLRQLVPAGHSVRALIRPKSDRRNLVDLPVEIVTGDLMDRPSLDRGVRAADAAAKPLGGSRTQARDSRSHTPGAGHPDTALPGRVLAGSASGAGTGNHRDGTVRTEHDNRAVGTSTMKVLLRDHQP